MPEQLKSLTDFLTEFNNTAKLEKKKIADQERAEILNKFPLESWPTMPLENYALGQPDPTETFCWWAEYNTPNLGSIRGGSALKHLIYYSKNDSEWRISIPEMKDAYQAWGLLRADFLEAFTLAQTNQWEKIDALPYLSGAKSLRLKTLHIYFPESLLPICSTNHIQHFLELFNVWLPEMGSWGSVKLNRTLFTHLRTIEKLSNWSTTELGDLLYAWADPRDNRKIIKVATGENGKHWEDFLENGIAAIGWDEIGNLQNFTNKEELITKYQEEHDENKSMITKKTKEIWMFFNLEPGDILIANKGISEILAVGEVLEPGYEWDDSRQRYKHTVPVKWDTTYAQTIEPIHKWRSVTIDTVSNTLYQKIVSGNPQPPPNIPVDPLFLTLEKTLERKRQIILYGPPGTGKTYLARRFVNWYLGANQDQQLSNNLTNNENLLANEQKLNESSATQRVWWLVANPKEWSWDQLFDNGKGNFRYGRIQRNYPLIRPGDLVVGYQTNPDKKIFALAKISKGLFEDQDGKPQIEITPLLKIKNGLTYEALLQDEILKNSEPLQNRCHGTLFALNQEEANYLLSRMAEDQPEIEKFLSSEDEIGPLTWLTFHPSYSYEDFVEGFRPLESVNGLVLKMDDGIFKKVCRVALAHPKQKYVIVIDEINRANLAKVFGELITLLEVDKRGLTITLPQSKERFSIPKNVYLIGTMNTADRSIKLLDVALRRRFAFFELMPEPELLEGVTINGLQLDLFLETLNKNIAKLEGREKQIGHALLMNDGKPITEPEEFSERFRQEILPLLQEYCYEDYSILENYLGKKLVDQENNRLNADIIQNDSDLIEALVNLIKTQED